jgi:carbonic anhydrase/acetyltransferase-like protein (isoleucine patch superfamily)
MLYQLGTKSVTHGSHLYVAPGAHIIGDVVLGDNVSVWFNAVIRGDSHQIKIGDNTNIQDGSVLHTDDGVPLTLGHGVTIGHKVMLHGCEVGDYSLIGINSVILNGAKIGRYCVIGANSLVTEKMVVPDYSVVMGSPGKVVKTLESSVERQLEASSRHYVENAQRYMKDLKLQSK